MTQFVLDTNVVSALRVPGRHPEAAAWAQQVRVHDQFITALTVAEIERGILSRGRSDARQAAILNRWFEDQVLPTFAGRILSFDLSAARILARYEVPAHAPYDDALIAAVAEANAMTVATRNVRHFIPLGVALVNPWD